MMFVVERSVVGRMRFNKGYHEDERRIFVSLDKIAGLPLQKIRLREFQRQVTDCLSGESTVLVIWAQPFRYQKFAVITDPFDRHPLMKSALGGRLFPQMPFSDVAGAIV